MSENGKGNPEVIEFEELDAEENTTISKEEQLATFLKDKLSEEDFGAAAKLLGVDAEDLSNAELLEKLIEMFQGKSEEEKPEDEPEEEKEMADYKTFMKDCMAEGKTMEECQAEYKKKYPEEKKEETAPEDLAKPEDEKYTELNTRIAELENQVKLKEINAEVTELVSGKHLSPRQVAPVVKLSAAMSPELKEEFLGLFRSQKFTVSDDKGLALNKRPGELETIDEETRTRLMKEHGISQLIDERGIRSNN